jgi:chromosome segregation ATPase
MADPPSGDPSGEPPNSDQTMRLFQSQRPQSPPTFRRETRAYKRQRNSSTTATNTTRTCSLDFSQISEEGDKFDKVARLIADLKKTIIDQSHTIEKVTAELTGVKSEQTRLATQNDVLQNEIRSLRGQLSALLETPPLSRS